MLIIVCSIHTLFTAIVRAFNNAIHTNHLVTLIIFVFQNFFATLIVVMAVNGKPLKLA